MTPRPPHRTFRRDSYRIVVLGVFSWFFTATQPALAQPAPDAPPAQPAPDAAAELEAELTALVGRPGGLTADATAARALASSQDLVAADSRRAAAAAEVARARAGTVPRLTTFASYQRLSPIDAPALGTLVVAPTAEPGPIPAGTPLFARPFSFPVVLDQIQVGASLVVPLTDYFLRFPQALAAAEQGRTAREREAEARRHRTAAEARLAYYAWVRAELQHVAARQARALAVEHLRDVERLVAAGLATSADQRGVEAQEAQAELIELRASDAAAVAAARLAIVQHLPPGTAFAIGEDVLAPPREASAPALESAFAEAERQRPELRALAASEASLREQERALKAQQYPRVDATGDALLANPNPRYFPAEPEFHATWAVGVRATWVPTDTPAARASRRVLSAQAQAIAAEQGALRDALRAEIVGTTRGVEQSRRAIAAAERQHTAAAAAYGVRRDQYLAGRATSVELTDAETDLTRARIELIDALVGARIARVQLDHALGRTR